MREDVARKIGGLKLVKGEIVNGVLKIKWKQLHTQRSRGR